jgi:hypothetical protein
MTGHALSNCRGKPIAGRSLPWPPGISSLSRFVMAESTTVLLNATRSEAAELLSDSASPQPHTASVRDSSTDYEGLNGHQGRKMEEYDGGSYPEHDRQGHSARKPEMKVWAPSSRSSKQQPADDSGSPAR